MNLTGISILRSRPQGHRNYRAPSNSIRAFIIAAALLGTEPYGNAASITGKVKIVGVVPEGKPIRVTKDQDYCGQTLPNESYVIGPSRGLKNVVVYIDHPLHSPTLSREEEDKENLLDNRACRFVPRVLAMRWGERLVVRNSDSKLHIVHAYFDKRTVFNLSLPFRGSRIEITQKIRRPALLQINCDTHGWMRAYIHVFGHPLFTVTDESGFFNIANVPAGRYSLMAWHEEAGVRSAEVTVPEEGEARVNFEFSVRASP